MKKTRIFQEEVMFHSRYSLCTTSLNINIVEYVAGWLSDAMNGFLESDGGAHSEKSVASRFIRYVQQLELVPSGVANASQFLEGGEIDSVDRVRLSLGHYCRTVPVRSLLSEPTEPTPTGWYNWHFSDVCSGVRVRTILLLYVWWR